MSHYEQRLEKDLEHIRGEVSDLATSVKQAVKNSIHALLTANQDLASATILGDGPINRKIVRLTPCVISSSRCICPAPVTCA